MGISRVFVKTLLAFGRRRFHQKNTDYIVCPAPVVFSPVVSSFLVVLFFCVSFVLCVFLVFLGSNAKKTHFGQSGSGQSRPPQILAKVGQLRLAKVGQKFLAKVGLAKVCPSQPVAGCFRWFHRQQSCTLRRGGAPSGVGTCRTFNTPSLMLAHCVDLCRPCLL